MWSIDACLYSYCFLSLSLAFFPIFLSFLWFFHVFLCLLFLIFYHFRRPFTVHGYPFLYHLPLWDLPFLSFNRFGLLMSIPPGLPTSLSAA